MPIPLSLLFSLAIFRTDHHGAGYHFIVVTTISLTAGPIPSQGQVSHFQKHGEKALPNKKLEDDESCFENPLIPPKQPYHLYLPPREATLTRRPEAFANFKVTLTGALMAVIQFIDFAYGLITKGIAIHSSMSGLPISHQELKSITESLSQSSNDIHESLESQ
ncbi:hypothetical protein F5Y12DRAFT_717041 [Xylaria sp. FL1777]|nr:hypothetical protein F5Y12DRAFT_717041 [Xylaria sp. FL1777]